MTHKYKGKQKTDFIDDQCSFLFRIFIDPSTAEFESLNMAMPDSGECP